LPNAEQAIIPEAKLRQYLLNSSNPQNRGKARLFRGMGYAHENWKELESAIRTLISENDAREIDPNAQGRRWQVVGEIRGAQGRATILTGWIILFGEDVPRFVTAYRA